MLIAFLLLFLFKGVVYAAYITPINLLATPDDVGHISYLIFLGANHRRPLLNSTMLEGTSFANYLDFRDGVIDDGPYIIEDITTYTDTYQGVKANQENWIAQHPPLYYLYLLPLYYLTTTFTHDLSLIILWMRIATIPLGLIAMVFVYLSLKHLKISIVGIQSALIIFSFTPAIQFYFCAVNNDAMVICLSCAAFYFFVKYLTGDRIWDLCIFAAVCGGITISKYTGAVVLPAYVVVYIWYSFAIRKVSACAFLKRSLLCIIVFAAVAAPVLLKNYVEYSQLFPTYTDGEKAGYDYTLSYFLWHTDYFNELVRHIMSLIGWRVLLIPSTICRQLYVLPLLFIDSYKMKHNTAMLVLPLAVAILLTNVTSLVLVTAFAIFCLWILIIHESKDDLKAWRYEPPVALLSSLMVISFCTAMLVVHFNAYKVYNQTRAMQGRYYHPLILPYFYLLFRDFSGEKDTSVQFFPILLLAVNVFAEVRMIWEAITTW